jgi:protein tyrosine/serine phosphatase
VAAGSSTAASAVARIHIDNFGQVNPNYYRGGQPKGHDYADLAAAGVKTLIDLAGDGDPAEDANARAAGLHFVRIPMTTHRVPGADTIARFLTLVNDPSNQPVYVHCIGGRHRTGVMTAIYRMTNDGWTPAQAFDEMKHYKFGADFLHQEFKDFVYGFVAPAATTRDVSSRARN